MGRTLTAKEIGRVAAELDATLAGALLQEARQPAPLDLYLELRVPGESVTVLLSAAPDLSRLHVTAARPQNPPVPFAFQSLLRARLCGERLARVAARDGDRVVTLEFSAGRALVAELTGRHANVFYCEEGLIVGSLRPNLSQRRALVPGKPYIPPAPRPPAAAAPELSADSHQLSAPSGPLAFSRALDAAFASLVGAEERALAIARAKAALARERKRTARLRENIARDLAAADGAPDYTRFGEAIKRGLHALKRGMAEARLTEYAADGPRAITVALKPELGPKENMERYFRLARRMAGARDRIAARLREAGGRAGLLDEIDRGVEACKDAEGVVRLLATAGVKIARPQAAAAAAVSTAKAPREPARKSYREYFIEGAGLFLVGGSAEDNDALTFRVARGSDLWFHVVAFPGAHVVAPLPRDREPSQPTVHAGARLAASRSKAPEGEKVEVAYTRQKYVRKPKGAKPGLVLVSQEKRILVTVEKSLYADCLVDGGGEEQ